MDSKTTTSTWEIYGLIAAGILVVIFVPLILVIIYVFKTGTIEKKKVKVIEELQAKVEKAEKPEPVYVKLPIFSRVEPRSEYDIVKAVQPRPDINYTEAPTLSSTSSEASSTSESEYSVLPTVESTYVDLPERRAAAEAIEAGQAGQAESIYDIVRANPPSPITQGYVSLPSAAEAAAEAAEAAAPAKQPTVKELARQFEAAAALK
jgi:hypothetical protein